MRPTAALLARTLRIAAFTLGVAIVLPGCATSPTDQEAARRAWAERDAERARECRAAGRAFVAGGCAGGGP
jgi:hypothetical protein